MTKSTFFKYLPARLKPLGKPAVWIPLTVATLAGAFAWEYYTHPEWFKPEPIINATPGELTAEEAAQLSEIDTLDVLLNGSRAPEGTEAVTGQINLDTPNQSKAQNDVQPDPGNATTDNPFDGSFEAYPIPGARITGASASTSGPAQSSLYSETPLSAPNAAAGGDRFNFGNGLVNPAAPATNSALSEAINRRDAARVAEPSNNAPGEGDANPSIFDGEGASRQSGTTRTGTTGSALPAANPVPGSFIRTTPQMSPPVGTTGYQPPATSDLPAFNVTPTQPTRNPFAPAPQSNQVSQPTVPFGQATPLPAAVGSPTSNGSSAAPGGGALYTPPTSVQPDQGRAINPRR